MVNLRHPKRCRKHAPAPHRLCRACEETSPLAEMVPVGSAPIDLGTILGGQWLCRDEKACLRRYAARNKGDALLHAVIMPANPLAWAGGTILLLTDNPRHAEQHAAAYGACVARWRIHTDYREGRT